MKAHLKFLTLITVLAICSCVREELEPIDSDIVLEKDNTSLKSFNNGIIKSYPNDLVLKWNEAISLSIDNQMPPPAEARIYAMVSLAIHDALNNVLPRYDTYAMDNSDVDASALSKENITQISDAAVSQAAYQVLTAVFPGSKTLADALLATSLSGITDPGLKSKGVSVGASAAAALLLKRQNDISLGFSSYSQGTEPGVHQSDYMPWALANPPVWPDNAVYAANLGSMQPFGMNSSDQFRAIPPDAVNSRAFTGDYNEVKRLGCTTCPDRSPEQTQIGAFWVENVSSSTNRIARYMANQEKLDGWETARLLALLHITQIDANISSFEGKYYFKFWRPITAIRGGDADGNDNTAGDPDWTPTFLTPPTPDYPSTHACTGGAGSELLKLFFGKDKISMKVTSPYSLPGVERTLGSFTQIGRENAISRIYIGYHFRKAVVEGEKTGRQIGSYVFENKLRELKK